MADLVIYALRVGGGILALSPMPGAGGNYDQDLEFLRDWKPALVLSMTPEPELAGAGAATLGADLQAMGTRWMHFPVPDFGTPAPRVGMSWPKMSRQILSALNGGGRVLVHCMGGRGRSGMAVMRLMVEAGEDPSDALSRLRAVRAGAVETEAQWHWAKEGARADEGEEE